MTTSPEVDRMIGELTDWRGKTLATVRKAFLAADPAIVEEFKWMGSPTWSCDGLLAVGDAHKAKVKVTFAHGAKFADPDGLFNGKDNGNTRRSIDYFEKDVVDGTKLTALARTAIQFNRSNLKKNTAKAKKA